MNLIQTGIEIGANVGLINIKDMLEGRQTIRQEVLSELDQDTNQICSLLGESIK